MSHVTTIHCEDEYDIASLKQMCHDMGWTFCENQRTYKWFGRHVGDYPVPEGFTLEDMGKCDHAIRIPGAAYEIGVVKKGDKWKLVWDFWGSGGLPQKLGKNAEVLKQAYRTAKVKTTARKHRKRYWSKPAKKAGWNRLFVEVEV